ncbi:MAG: hypothetical protein NTW78_03075 [Campylobacterales bacterium]|nr:hypothetical protein [Campylobacterales bacterium]
MGIATILGPLAVEYGPKMARYLSDKISADSQRKETFAQGMVEGVGLPEILKKIFGEKLQDLLTEAKHVKKMKYESHFRHYISLKIDENLADYMKNDLLKAELAENLERLSTEDLERVEMINRSRSILNKWMKKFVEIKNPDEEALKKLQVLEDILNSKKMTAKDVFKKLKPLFGASGVLTLIYTAMLASGAGMGIFYSIGIWFSGVPIGQIFTLTSTMLLLAYLALVPINDESKIQIIINGIYGIIDGNIEDFAEIIKKEKQIYQDENKQKDLMDELNKKIYKNETNSEMLILIISLFKYTILIDAKEHHAEKEVIVNFLKNEYALTNEEVDYYYEIAPNIEDIEDFLKELSELLSKKDSNNIINVIKRIIIADEDIHHTEVELFKLINKYFKET